MNKAWMIIIIAFLSGCASFESKINYSFVDKSVSEEHVSRGDGRCEYRVNASGIKPRYHANILANNELYVDIEIFDPKTKINFIGPGILVPLPVLPWPPGLFETSDKETLSIKISYATTVSGYTYNPEESYISINGNTHTAETLSQTNTTQLTVTDPLKDNRYIYTPFLYKYDSSVFKKRSLILLYINGVYKNEIPIKIQPLELELLNITEFYWMWGFLNC